MGRRIEQPTDCLDLIDNETLLEKIEHLGLGFIVAEIRHVLADSSTADEFRRILCDVLSLGYQVSDDEILGRIKENL